MPEPGISVVICCFNSASRLGETLKHLALQKGFNDTLWEVIVVDNASTDDTFGVAKQLWSGLNRPEVGFKIVREPNPGKSHALKKGIENAAFDLVLVCDDDNWLRADYLEKAFQFMQADQEIGVLGGCGIFHPEMPSRPEIAGHEIAFVNGPQTWARQDHWVYGAGSLFRKKIITDLFEKGWTPLVGGKNAAKMVGEDVELCYICYLNGYRIASNDLLLFDHFVPLKKQRVKYILQLIYRQSYSFALLTGYRKLIDGDMTPIRKNLNTILVGSLKALLRGGVRGGWLRLSKHKANDFNFRAAMNTYKGALFAILQNRRRIIEHYASLSEKELIKERFSSNGSVAD